MEEGPAATFSGLSQAELQLLADNQPTLCRIAAADGYIVWYNVRWHEYCGTTSTEMEGWGWQSVHDPTILPQVMTRWTASIAAGVPFEMTFPLKGADGIYRPFLTRVAPLKNSRGEVIRWFGNNIDVTAQLRSEDARQEAEDRLRALNAEHDREQILVAESQSRQRARNRGAQGTIYRGLRSRPAQSACSARCRNAGATAGSAERESPERRFHDAAERGPHGCAYR